MELVLFYVSQLFATRTSNYFSYLRFHYCLQYARQRTVYNPFISVLEHIKMH